MSKVYKTVNHPVGYYALPWFEIKDGKIYSTPCNPEGYIATYPVFEIKDNKIYTTPHHPQGLHIYPWFEIRGNEIHKTPHHPRYEPRAYFEIREK